MDNTVVIGPTYNKVEYWDSTLSPNTTIAWDGIKLVSGSSTITDSYIFGFRAPVSVVASNGDSASPSTVKIENTTIEGGSLANLHIGSVGNLILDNVNTVQDSNGYDATVGTGKTYGLGVYFDDYCKGTVTLSGNTKMYNWISKTESGSFNKVVLFEVAYQGIGKQFYAKDVINTMVDKGSQFLHSGYINTGFIQDGGTAKNTIAYSDTYTGDRLSSTSNIELSVKIIVNIKLKTLCGWSVPTCSSDCTHTSENFLPDGWTHQSTNHSEQYLASRIPTTAN